MTAGDVVGHSGAQGAQGGQEAGSVTDEQAAQQHPDPGAEGPRPEETSRPAASAAPASEARHGQAVERLEVADPAAPAHGPDPGALDGPFTTRQLLRLDEALRVADDSTGLTFSVYVGELEEPVRAHAEKLHAQLAEPARSVLVAVSPNQRLLEIVTGPVARRQLPDRDCKLAALSMTAAFSGGDLAGGIVTGVAQLANQARA